MSGHTTRRIADLEQENEALREFAALADSIINRNHRAVGGVVETITYQELWQLRDALAKVKSPA